MDSEGGQIRFQMLLQLSMQSNILKAIFSSQSSQLSTRLCITANVKNRGIVSEAHTDLVVDADVGRGVGTGVFGEGFLRVGLGVGLGTEVGFLETFVFFVDFDFFADFVNSSTVVDLA